jgi:serine/threonine-protein kinase
MDKYLGKKLGGRYEINKLIGVGGMSYVYKAYDCIDDRVVSVKILKEEFLHNEEFTRRFKNESKAIAIISHPNIVRVYDVNFDERLQYIVMEYIDGITLKEYVDQQKEVRWREAVHFTVQILRALQHAHDKGIIHRDIKPQNIMLLPDGTIKVTDFGIARLSRSELRPPVAGEKAIGSVHYISPEQAKGELTDERADLYSVGVMMYEMLTGRLPFDADNAVSVAIMQLQSEAQRPRKINEDIPEGLEEITMKAMQKEASERYQSAAEMLSDIDEFKKNPSIRFEYQYFAEEPTRYIDAIAKIKGEEPEEELEEEEEKGETPVLPILAAVAGAVLVVALVFGIVSVVNKIGGGGNSKNTVEVENFIGKHYASELANNAEFLNTYELEFVYENSTEYGEGYVLWQKPKAGDRIKIKDTLTLCISTGEKLSQVPEVKVGEHVDMVRARLEQAGFVVRIVEENSTEHKEDTVIKTVPEYPNRVPSGSEIQVFVSLGEEKADPVVIPNIQNVALKDAISRLTAAGFAKDKIKTTVVNNKAPKDTVIGISPAVGTEVDPASEITLTVSSGYQDVQLTVPLPNTSTAVDLRIFVAGQENKTLSNSFKGILPDKKKQISFTVSEQTDSYDVTIQIAVAGTENYQDYTNYLVSGSSGMAQQQKAPVFNEPVTGTTTTAAPDMQE